MKTLIVLFSLSPAGAYVAAVLAQIADLNGSVLFASLIASGIFAMLAHDYRRTGFSYDRSEAQPIAERRTASTEADTETAAATWSFHTVV